jgi:hypothetical protein
VHFLEAEDADRAALFLCPRIVGSDPDALEGIQVADFVGDRVLGHRRERAEDADRSGGGSTFVPQHVVDQGQGVAAAQFGEGPVPQRDALDLHVSDSADPVVVGGVGALGSGVALGPGLKVGAQGVGAF